MAESALKRRAEWELELYGVMRQANDGKAFDFGRFDCFTFAADCVLAITGTDAGAAFRGKYSTREEADQLGAIEQLVEQLAAEFGMEEIQPTTLASRGDLVLIENPDRAEKPALAIVGLEGRFAYCPGEKGLTRVAMKRWRRAWKVGR